MCNCLVEVSERLEERAAKSASKTVGFQGVKNSYFENEILLMYDKSVQSPFAIPFVTEYERKSKAGNVRVYKEKINLLPTYCPVCGVKYSG